MSSTPVADTTEKTDLATLDQSGPLPEKQWKLAVGGHQAAGGDDANFEITPEQEELLKDLEVQKSVLRPVPWEHLTVPPDFKAKQHVDWKPSTGPALDEVNNTLVQMMPNVEWATLIEEWKKAVVLPTDTVLADLRLIGMEDLPLLPGLRIGHGGLLLVQREAAGGGSFLAHEPRQP